MVLGDDCKKNTGIISAIVHPTSASTASTTAPTTTTNAPNVVNDDLFHG